MGEIVLMLETGDFLYSILISMNWPSFHAAETKSYSELNTFIEQKEGEQRGNAGI
jgi:hypothetical protein